MLVVYVSSSVGLVLEVPSCGGVLSMVKVVSIHLYRYITLIDQLILAAEVSFIPCTLYAWGWAILLSCADNS